jgi:hypothetical protein
MIKNLYLLAGHSGSHLISATWEVKEDEACY